MQVNGLVNEALSVETGLSFYINATHMHSPLTVGITGGIGSGKTTVCQILQHLGAPVWYADAEAKKLMQYGSVLQPQIQAIFGDEVYAGEQLQRAVLSAKVFAHAPLLQQLNALVHPAVQQAWGQWKLSQKFPYVVKEAAIFFESGTAADVDCMVMVKAPEALRILRTMRRDDTSREKTLHRMAQQLDASILEKLCDAVVVNDDLTPLLPQCLHFHALWMKLKS